MIIGTCHCSSARWTLDGEAGSITACNCTLCRRYGVLWAYDYEGERVHVTGQTNTYINSGNADPDLEILFCPTCACVVAWCGLKIDQAGRRRMAVNIRLAPPDTVADLPIDHFDGLDSYADLPADGRCVRDMWF
jgi:hypothetical protein